MLIQTNKSGRFITHLISTMLLLLLGSIWAAGFLIARHVTLAGISPLSYTFWETFFPTLLLFGWLKINKGGVEFQFHNLRFYLFCGACGIALPNSIMYFVAPHVPAGILSIIINSTPIYIYIFALLLELEPFKWTRFLGIFFGVVALGLVLFSKINLGTGVISLWALLALLVPLGYAVSAIYITKNITSSTNQTQLIFGILFFATLFLTPVISIFGKLYWFNWPLTAIDALIILEALLSAVGYIVLVKLLQRIGPVYYSLVNAIAIILTVIFGHILFAENLNSYIFVAVVFVLLGITSMNLS